jgi:hypothetical protein
MAESDLMNLTAGLQALVAALRTGVPDETADLAPYRVYR